MINDSRLRDSEQN